MLKKLIQAGEYSAVGLMEEPDRSLFYRKALSIRRFYEHCRLAEYTGKPLYPSGVINGGLLVRPHYLNGIDVRLDGVRKIQPEVADRIEQDFFRFRSTVPKKHTVAGDMYTHSMPHYERILREGLHSYKERILKVEDADFREGLMHLVCGIETYVSRCIAYLEQQNADEKLIAALKQVPMYPARNIYEAVVAWNFVMYLDNCDNLGCVDSGLMPYYHGENIVPLLQNLYDNLDENEGYSMALGKPCSLLTEQCLLAAEGKRRPMIELFVDESTPDSVWDAALRLIRSGGGQPAFYNPHVLLNGLRERFSTLTQEDAEKFCGGGCTEAMIAGLSNVGSLDAGINLLLILEKVLQTKLLAAESFEELYDSYIEAVGAVVDSVAAEIYHSQKQRAACNPLPMRTLLVDDCIDNATEYNHGGARYCWSVVNFAGMINVIDALMTVKEMVFGQKSITAESLLEGLANNDACLLKRLRENPCCFGVDHEEVNRFGHQLTETIFGMLRGKKTYYGEGFLPSSIQFLSQVEAGKNIGATPDGRESGAPLCDSLGAIFGKDVKGPTALLKSVTSLDLKQALGIPVLNFNINPGFRDDVMKGLILGYMSLGGIQMQITCISAEQLQQAYENPELHKNIVVRVGGYSEYFSRLSDELKRMVINRTIQSEV